MNNTSKNQINIDTILKDNGLKVTPARLSILNIFTKSKFPLNAFSVYSELSKDKKNKNINEATVYRTLSSLEKNDILKIVNLRKDSVYFELNNDHHHHIVCTICGTVEDFKENISIEKILSKIIEKSTKFKKIKEHSLELFGICKVCN
ncbi:MAG: Fur family transcriptional regulator [Candidatus Nomurabacteria bacterium]|nr:Fur family transcriptional regulator [Candidatus Nomurabacteria bacterium]